ncbi:MAG: family transporter [Steroidobacteraceae bacterium]|nr:family transporter [Steroidobacteraceae bacterium]MBM2853873.1 family transporter [Steroidobacteraceae bacterium]
MREKPRLGFWQVWNMSFGFLGIQFGFALQNANVSRIFQSLGASVDDLPILWLAAPVTGLLVQPVIGYMSDRTWGRLGRRRPYFLVGAVLSTLALLVMPNSPWLWVAAGTLWILDASINVTMEPFRALVGDMLPDRQRTFGFALQSLFIGVGAVVASALPWALANWAGFSNTAVEGALPDSVKWAFYLGAIAFIGAVLWTVASTNEYSPAELAGFSATHEAAVAVPTVARGTQKYLASGAVWILVGAAFSALVAVLDWEKQLYVLGGGSLAFGVLQLAAASLQSRGRTGGALYGIVNDLFNMPRAMRQLAVVQFLSWFGLFAMWIYTTSAVTSRFYGTSDAASAAFNEGANWVGVLFAGYNGFAALAAIMIPFIAARIGRRRAHLLSLSLGGAGLISFLVIDDPHMLLLAMVGVGIAWASILSLPYAMLSGAVPPAKMGVYMGIFNFFIVIPQIMAASVLGVLVRVLFSGQSVYALATGGVLMVLAGLATLRVDDQEDPRR